MQPEMFVHVWGVGTSAQLCLEGPFGDACKENELCEGNGNTRGRLCEQRLWRPGGCFSGELKMRLPSLRNACRCRAWGNTPGDRHLAFLLKEKGDSFLLKKTPESLCQPLCWEGRLPSHDLGSAGTSVPPTASAIPLPVPSHLRPSVCCDPPAILKTSAEQGFRVWSAGAPFGAGCRAGCPSSRAFAQFPGLFQAVGKVQPCVGGAGRALVRKQKWKNSLG